MNLLVAFGTDRELFAIESSKNGIDAYGFLSLNLANITNMVHFHSLGAGADTTRLSQFGA